MIKFLRHFFLPFAQSQGSNRAKNFASWKRLGGNGFSPQWLSKALASKHLRKGSLTRLFHCQGIGIWFLLPHFLGGKKQPEIKCLQGKKSSFNDQSMPWGLCLHKIFGLSISSFLPDHSHFQWTVNFK